MIRVMLPYHLRQLARVDTELEIDVPSPVSIASTLDAIEACFPMLRGAIRDHATRQRRPFVRFFACGQDLSHDPPEKELPAAVTEGRETLMIIGAIAGG